MIDIAIQPGTRVFFLPAHACADKGRGQTRKPTTEGVVTEIHDRFFVVEYGHNMRECFYPDDVREQRITIMHGQASRRKK